FLEGFDKGPEINGDKLYLFLYFNFRAVKVSLEYVPSQNFPADKVLGGVLVFLILDQSPN
ncbi:MAG: hypothetical protein GTN39_00010, partial [Candidatus Aenigmarchaeota archaeon]|nr:hypothetical protein [Candidatus Aenigmarchaeota archaeon]